MTSVEKVHFAVVLVLFLSFGHAAEAGCPEPYDEETCEGVCYDCDVGGTEQICCDLTADQDRIILIEDTEPIAYGTIHIGQGSEDDFCCTASDMGVSACAYVVIDADPGSSTSMDWVCLQDSTASGCENRISGLQYWTAGADIDTDGGNDLVLTSPSGAYDDTVNVGSGDDVVYTYDGEDTIYGMSGDDIIHAGDGADVIDGGYDGDGVWAGSGPDTIDGGNGGDGLRGEGHADTIEGGADDDNLFGGSGNDDVMGDGGEDFVGGDAGDDCLCGGSSGTGLNDDGDPDTLNGNASDVNGDLCYYYSTEGDTGSNCDHVDTDSDTDDCLCGP